MEELALQALSNFKIRDVAIVHRVGRMEIGQTSVAIVVASAHRAAAFDACDWLIDTLKRAVPIWKKEYFEDGRFGRMASRSRPRFSVPEAPNLGSVHLNRRTNLSARFAANLCNRCR